MSHVTSQPVCRDIEIDLDHNGMMIIVIFVDFNVTTPINCSTWGASFVSHTHRGNPLPLLSFSPLPGMVGSCLCAFTGCPLLYSRVSFTMLP